MTTWHDYLKEEKQQPYFQNILHFIEQELAAGKTIYPPKSQIFNALKLTPFDAVKVVIIGQDPYHGPNQAHGLCFSVKDGVVPPPSLVNIFQELKDDLGIEKPKSGCLEGWAKQGVLLLNAVLSVEAGKAGSHAGIGWERFTDKIISVLNENKEHLVFLLWGSYAIKKAASVDKTKHLVLTTVHPSPLSAYRGFFGCKHFSKANAYLTEHGIEPINWAVNA